MSFINKLCRTLGFGGGEEYETDADIISDETETETAVMEQTAATDCGDTAGDKRYDDMREAIFKQVVEVFNAALPDFIARSVNPEAQRKLLFDSLDQGLKDYVAGLGADADRRCEQRWNNEQAQLRADMESLRHKSDKVEAERAELKQRQLSAERQKRALSERLKDLEKQVESLEAEREQFDLENKSLLNKLKVMAVQGQEPVDAAVAIDGTADKEEIERLSGRVKELEEEIATQKQQLEQAAERVAMADEMTADLRKRLAVSQKEVEDLQVITEQVGVVQQAIEERDRSLERQRENIARLKDQIETLTARAKSAEDRGAERERELLDRIMQLETRTAVSELLNEEAKAPKKPRKRQAVRKEPEPEAVAPKITDDDLMDVESCFADHSWFGATEPMPSVTTPAVENDDFGYHAPEPKPRPYDDGMQMSLFDD